MDCVWKSETGMDTLHEGGICHMGEPVTFYSKRREQVRGRSNPQGILINSPVHTKEHAHKLEGHPDTGSQLLR